MSALLLIPFFLVRFGLLSLLSGEAVQRAAHFAPMEGRERLAYWVYQISTAGLILSLFFLNFRWEPLAEAIAGGAVYCAGIGFLAASVVYFAAPSKDGLRQDGVYRVSRHPMYTAYFLVFLGGVLLTQSWILLGWLAAFQISAGAIVRAEERWCLQCFGEEYRQYMGRVRRWI